MSSEIVEWLGTTEANEGLTLDARNKFSSQLESEDAYQIFANVVMSPPETADADFSVALSYRALKVLLQDLENGSPLLMNATRAGLLTKKICSSFDGKGVLIHKRILLDSLLSAYPSAVVSAVCAGGKDGLDAHVKPMMLPETCSQTLPTLASLILYGCTGKNVQSSAESRPMMAGASQTTSQISNGHRRKFVKSLYDWKLLQRLADCIAQEEHCTSPIGLGEEACETLLTIVECLGHPDPSADSEEDVGEQVFLSPLGQAEWWDSLVTIIAHSPLQNESARIAAARAMVGIFGLATGHSLRLRRIAASAPATEAVEDAKMGPDVEAAAAANNKLREWGLTHKIHMSLVTHLPKIVQALTVDEDDERNNENFKATIYIQSGGDPDTVPETAIPHPGRCRIIPFTSWRLQIVNLLAELLSYDGDKEHNTSDESPRCAAMSAFMELPLPPMLQKDGDKVPQDDHVTFNPWPALCDWVFQYPENNLFHVQFLRMFQAICLEHHESTLRLVLQKAKFVSRAVRTCKSGGPLRGVLITALNYLRLRCFSLPPRDFLRQFLESHDAWKDFQDELRVMTMEQEVPFGARPVLGQQAVTVKSGDIDLGSSYASQLGFDGIKVYEGDGAMDLSATSSKKKKKKRKKKKKKAEASEGQEEDDGAE